ncbi:PhoX family phosphatase [Glutamicibacter sp. MNS18]|uniref:PhoX family protein n=1 Tax=Glutamicibacter sp. MNS18 TaxID=2989817 RepID=UPI002235BF81|nr:PhoX family phosphatase [Glutamicibacter sp. MNS18]MCW4464083.1 PhoX family phosphatase [Glutamicibacter sp. MNS18]
MESSRRLLPMQGHTRGNRSAATCHYKCGDACAQPYSNTSENAYFKDIADAALSRRKVLGLGALGAAALVVGPQRLSAPAAQAGTAPVTPGSGKLPFTAIGPVSRSVDTMSVPEGYDWRAIIRWGDPLFGHSPNFDAANQSARAQSQQFGYNCDYLDILPDGENGNTGVLVANHEYTNEEMMFDPQWLAGHPDEARRTAMAAHGFSVVEITRRWNDRRWSYVRGNGRNRRLTLDSEFTVDGPAAGSALLRTKDDPQGLRISGTLNNCAGGTTPWGTVLTGEENFDQYFRGRGTEQEARYGIKPEETERGWEHTEPRFGLHHEGYENEAHRFGWIVEIDPQDPESIPVKHTSLGRFKHEGANVRIAENGKVIAYSGDDSRFEYLYKFVSHETYREGDRAHNMRLLSAGDLYVATFAGNSPAEQIDGSGAVPADGSFDGTGRWVPLVQDGVSKVEGMSVDEVLVFTRLAADRAGATKLDRPEDVEPSPVTGKVYVALTNNTDRGETGTEGATEVSPRLRNRDGHVLELGENPQDATATDFVWNILLVAGDPRFDSSTYFSGYPAEKVSPISCPDNLAFDSLGNLWISTDGAPSTIGYSDALHKVTLEGEQRGRVEQFLAVPTGAETCGPVVRDEERSVFVAVQHPGEGGTYAEPQSLFPDFVASPVRAKRGEFHGPRPSVVQVYRRGWNFPRSN